jgi:hypothetical protein
MVVTAVDVDLKCVYMTYLQLALYGIPALVICGDTLLAKEYSRWHTPVYILDGWQWKQECGITTKLIANQAPGLPEPEKVENVEHVGQLSLIDLDKAS